MVNRAHIAFTSMQRSDFHLYIVGCLLSEVVYKQLGDFFMLLVGNQTAGNFGVGFRRQYGLGTFAGISSPDAADIE